MPLERKWRREWFWQRWQWDAVSNKALVDSVHMTRNNDAADSLSQRRAGLPNALCALVVVTLEAAVQQTRCLLVPPTDRTTITTVLRSKATQAMQLWAVRHSLSGPEALAVPVPRAIDHLSWARAQRPG